MKSDEKIRFQFQWSFRPVSWRITSRIRHTLKFSFVFIFTTIFFTGCSKGLSKSEFKFSSATRYEHSALLEMKRSVGSSGQLYLEKQDHAAPEALIGILDSRSEDWHPLGDTIVGLKVFLNADIKSDAARSIVHELNGRLPGGYRAILLDRPIDGRFVVLLQKTCGRQCSGKFAEFREKEWNTSERLPLAETLVHRQTLIGMTKAELFSLLGEAVGKSIPAGEGYGGNWVEYQYLVSQGCYLKVVTINNGIFKAWLSYSNNDTIQSTEHL